MPKLQSSTESRDSVKDTNHHLTQRDYLIPSIYPVIDPSNLSIPTTTTIATTIVVAQQGSQTGMIHQADSSKSKGQVHTITSPNWITKYLQLSTSTTIGNDNRQEEDKDQDSYKSNASSLNSQKPLENKGSSNSKIPVVVGTLHNQSTKVPTWQSIMPRSEVALNKRKFGDSYEDKSQDSDRREQSFQPTEMPSILGRPEPSLMSNQTLMHETHQVQLAIDKFSDIHWNSTIEPERKYARIVIRRYNALLVLYANTIVTRRQRGATDIHLCTYYHGEAQV
jgi:hypothetical protein